ncbi:MAG: enoyl-CoA hydratase/isomerase family protein [Chloroflexi bacterium]|nr:enoyl-CoA hydratase/isomerase family protein [Chloroflexota bacterium]
MSANKEIFVKRNIQDGIAFLTLDRAPLNVLNIPMLEQMRSAISEVSGDKNVRCLVLEAEGEMFSAGVDVADHTQEKVGEMIPLFNKVCQDLANFPAPTIASIHGNALGGGCELVLCCDLAVMSEDAKIGQPEIHLAAIAPIAALRLSYMVGYRSAAELLFTGYNISAQEALRIGLMNTIAPAQQVRGLVLEKAEQISSLSRAAQQINKRALLIGYGHWAKQLGEVESIYLEELMNTPDSEEGLNAFMEKRPPTWKHN